MSALSPQLEAFLEVARVGTVSGAAEVMHFSQPTITARIEALETSLGVRLFERTRRGVRLTAAGARFLPYAAASMQAIRDGVRALRGDDDYQAAVEHAFA